MLGGRTFEPALQAALDVSPDSCSFHHLVTKLSQRFPTFIIKLRGHCLIYTQHRNVIRFSQIGVD